MVEKYWIFQMKTALCESIVIYIKWKKISKHDNR